MQLCSGDDFGCSQSTIRRAISDTLTALSAPEIVARFIKFPFEPQAIQRNATAFYRIARFHGVVGVIDGTHVRIVAPTENVVDYVNIEQRKFGR